MIQRLFCALAGLLLLAGCAQISSPVGTSCYHLNPAVETAIGYCETMRAGDVWYISGSVGKGDMPAAMRGAYDELKRTLQANGLGFENVVKENVFTTDLDAFIHNKDIRRTYYGQHLPAASWVEVRRLYSADLVVEIELTAVK